MTRKIVVLVKDVACPRCGAQPGEPCVQKGALIAFVSGEAFHKRRWEAALDELDRILDEQAKEVPNG